MVRRRLSARPRNLPPHCRRLDVLRRRRGPAVHHCAVPSGWGLLEAEAAKPPFGGAETTTYMDAEVRPIVVAPSRGFEIWIFQVPAWVRMSAGPGFAAVHEVYTALPEAPERQPWAS